MSGSLFQSAGLLFQSLAHSFLCNTCGSNWKGSYIPDCIHVSQGQPSSLPLIYTTEHLGWSKPLSVLLIETLLEVSTYNSDGTSASHILIQMTMNWYVHQNKVWGTEADSFYIYVTLSRSTWTKMRRLKTLYRPTWNNGPNSSQVLSGASDQLRKNCSTWIYLRQISYPDQPVPTWVELKPYPDPSAPIWIKL